MHTFCLFCNAIAERFIINLILLTLFTLVLAFPAVANDEENKLLFESMHLLLDEQANDWGLGDQIDAYFAQGMMHARFGDPEEGLRSLKKMRTGDRREVLVAELIKTAIMSGDQDFATRVREHQPSYSAWNYAGQMGPGWWSREPWSRVAEPLLEGQPVLAGERLQTLEGIEDVLVLQFLVLAINTLGGEQAAHFLIASGTAGYGVFWGYWNPMEEFLQQGHGPGHYHELAPFIATLFEQPEYALGARKLLNQYSALLQSKGDYKLILALARHLDANESEHLLISAHHLVTTHMVRAGKFEQAVDYVQGLENVLPEPVYRAILLSTLVLDPETTYSTIVEDYGFVPEEMHEGLYSSAVLLALQGDREQEVLPEEMKPSERFLVLAEAARLMDSRGNQGAAATIRKLLMTLVEENAEALSGDASILQSKFMLGLVEGKLTVSEAADLLRGSMAMVADVDRTAEWALGALAERSAENQALMLRVFEKLLEGHAYLDPRPIHERLYALSHDDNGRLNSLGQKHLQLFLSAIRHFKGMEAAIAVVNEHIKPNKRPQAFAMLALLGY